MPMFHRTPVRGLLMSTIVALALGGCSFSYSSGSSPPSNQARSNHGKPVPKKTTQKVDNREKALPSSSGEKPISKGNTDPAPEPPKKAEPTPEVEPDEAAPKRTTGAPKRTTGAPKRTPSDPTRTPVEDDTADTTDDSGKPNAGTSFKAKPAPKKPPTASGDLVAPR